MHGESSLMDLRNGYWLAAVGRLKPGVTIDQANAEMAALSRGILEATVPPQYDAEGQKHYLQYKFGAFPAATGSRICGGATRHPCGRYWPSPR